jgi:hypothetical protein
MREAQVTLQPLLHHAPHQRPHLFLLFFDTHFLSSGSKNCLPIFGTFTTFWFLHQIFHPHLRVGTQEEKDASQESRQGGKAPARQARQQLEDWYRE